MLKKEAIFDGPYVNTAPDLMIIPNEGIEISSEFYPGQILGKHSRGWTAGHRREGIIAARGPAVRPGVTIRGAKIYDMAPTILKLFGIRPEPSGSGRVLREICGGA